MKFTIFAALFAVIFAMAIAYPHEADAALDGLEETHEVSELQHGLRLKRATCDLFANEQLCAAHCLAKGFKGGWCDARKVCNCRK